jgi:hypothetical protein
MMLEIGMGFEHIFDSHPPHNLLESVTENVSISWIQTYIYDFGFGQVPKPEKWKTEVFDRSAEKGWKIAYFLIRLSSILLMISFKGNTRNRRSSALGNHDLR